MNKYRQDLKKILGRWDSIAIIIAIVIGAGIFKVPSEVAKYASSPNLIILIWLLGGVICLLGALCYAELSSSFPKTGGNYIYLRESYGPGLAFLFGWTELLVIRTGSIAAVSFIFAEHLQSLLSADKFLVKPIAISIVFILSIINIFGLHHGKRVQDISIIAKILALLGIIAFGFMSQKGNMLHFRSAPINWDIGMFQLAGLALIPVLWTYGGWHENTFVAEETRNARRTLPFALVTGISIITFIYLAMNLLYIYLMPVEEMANTELVASRMMHILYGENGKRILEISVVIFSLGCLNAMIITGGRVTYAMAKDNVIFSYIGKINTKYSTPHLAIIINAAWSVLLIILGTFNQLLFFTGIAVWLFFALVAAGLFILRHRFPDIERPYRVWGYPLIPIIFILVCTALFINTLIFYTSQSFIGLCLVMSGIPIYLISRKRSKNIHKP